MIRVYLLTSMTLFSNVTSDSKVIGPEEKRLNADSCVGAVAAVVDVSCHCCYCFVCVLLDKSSSNPKISYAVFLEEVKLPSSGLGWLQR